MHPRWGEKGARRAVQKKVDDGRETPEKSTTKSAILSSGKQGGKKIANSDIIWKHLCWTRKIIVSRRLAF